MTTQPMLPHWKRRLHLNEVEKRINTLYAEQSKLRGQKLSLAPWLGLDIPLEAESTREVTLAFGTISAQNSLWKRMRGSLSAATDLAQLTRAGSDGDLQYLFFACHKSAEEAATEVLKARGFSKANLRGFTGTAADNNRRLEGELERTSAEIEAAKAEVVSYAGERAALLICADRADQECP